MPKYTIEVQEVFTYQVDVEASTLNEAECEAEETVNRGNVNSNLETTTRLINTDDPEHSNKVAKDASPIN